MTTTIETRPNLLRNTLRGNSIFSAISGAIMIAAAGALASFMGIASPPLLSVMGVIIVGFALLMFTVTNSPTVHIAFARLCFAVDAAWVVATVVILAFNLFGLTNEGRWLLLIIGDIVAVFAAGEYIGLRRLR
jgi:hypothetical protein